MIGQRLLPVAVLIGALAPLAGAQWTTPDGVRLHEVARDFSRPVEITHAGDARLFVVEQEGRIMIVKAGRRVEEPFLDIRSEVSCCGERGLLGLAFPPDYAESGHFFVDYTGVGGHTVIARFTVSPGDPDRADPRSRVTVLSITQPFSNHNGGQVRFGPDGMLWIGMGDGGSGGDPMNNAQSLDTLLGKILRIDVSDLPYTIPPDNPFVGHVGIRPEIWSYGWRNPWRFSFDRLSHALFVGDVGQNGWEEIDFEPPNEGGRNYGWRTMEGTHCFDPQNGCDQTGLTLPILEYGHDEGCSVTAGFRYRGKRAPNLGESYVYGDYCSGTIWRAEESGGEWTSSVMMRTPLRITAFGEDMDGELYVADHREGVIYRFEGERKRRRATRRP